VGTFIARFSAGKDSPALENGLITQDYLPSADDTADPWIALFRAIHATYEPQEPFDNMTVYGMAAAYTFTDALWRAGRHPTRQSIVDLVNDGAVNLGGPGLVPLQYSAMDHDGYPGEQIGEVQDGKLILAGPVFVTHLSGPVFARPVIESAPPREPLRQADRGDREHSVTVDPGCLCWRLCDVQDR
jgi:hypothetical protein